MMSMENNRTDCSLEFVPDNTPVVPFDAPSEDVNTSIHSAGSSHTTESDTEPLITICNATEKFRENHLRTNSGISSLLNSVVTSVRRLQKSIGFPQGFSLLVGICIGGGIFISPSLVIADVKDVGVSLLVWLICGMIALLGALCYCELGTTIPRAGGNYAYILFIYGPVPAFICAWTQALLIDPGGVSVICLILGTYVMKPFYEIIEPNPWYPKIIALACILIIGTINCLSIKASTLLQSAFAACQALSILFIVILGIWKLCTGHTENFKNLFGEAHIELKNLGAYGAAFFGCLLSYNGWHMIGNVTEDMINIEKDLLRTVVISILFITVSYLAVNISFLTVLNPLEIGASHAVAIDYIRVLFGKKVAYIIPILVALSCYGSANGSMFACGRISLAAGREGHMPNIMGMIHRSRGTPIPAVFLTMCISFLMLILNANDINNLINFVCISSWFVNGIVLFGVLVLRIRKPDLHRPFKVWLIIPITMTIISLLLVAIPFASRPVNSAIAIGMILLGLPVYFFVIYLAPKHPTWLLKFNDGVTKCLKKNINLAPCAT